MKTKETMYKQKLNETMETMYNLICFFINPSFKVK